MENQEQIEKLRKEIMAAKQRLNQRPADYENQINKAVDAPPFDLEARAASLDNLLIALDKCNQDTSNQMSLYDRPSIFNDVSIDPQAILDEINRTMPYSPPPEESPRRQNVLIEKMIDGLIYSGASIMHPSLMFH